MSAWEFPLAAEPGSVVLLALPAVVRGAQVLPWDIGYVSSNRAMR